MAEHAARRDRPAGRRLGTAAHGRRPRRSATGRSWPGKPAPRSSPAPATTPQTVGTRLLDDCGTCSATRTRCPPSDLTRCTGWTRHHGPTGTASRSTPGTWPKLLKPYGSSRPRSGSASTSAGYRREDLGEAWRSYLSQEAEHPQQAQRPWPAIFGRSGRFAVPADCTACGEPLSQTLIDAGFTDHGEIAQ